MNIVCKQEGVLIFDSDDASQSSIEYGMRNLKAAGQLSVTGESIGT